MYRRRLRVDSSMGVNDGDNGEYDGVEIVNNGILTCSCGRTVGVNGGDGEIIFYFFSGISSVLANGTLLC